MKKNQNQQLQVPPLFYADWDSVVMIHLEVDPMALQQVTPFLIDTFDGKGYITLVAFTLRHLRPTFGGRLAAGLLRPIATHEFLNVRTYVKVNGEAGIHFLAEWLPNQLSVWLGPRTFGLPYRLGENHYEHEPERNHFCGRIRDVATATELRYQGRLANPDRQPTTATPASLEAFLWERYTAFNDKQGKRLKFHVTHPPWPMRELKLNLPETRLLTQNWPFIQDAHLVGAHFCEGLQDVQMSGVRNV